MTDGVRRVVTGHDADGKAVFASDEVVPPITTGLSASSSFHVLWGGDDAPHFPDDGVLPLFTTYFPPVGGFRFGMFTLPPHGEPGPGPDVDIAAAIAEMRRALPGMLDYMEPGAPGMHTTDTIDFEVVLSGEVTLELDDGAVVHLRPATRSCRTAPGTVGGTPAQKRRGSPSSSAARTTIASSGRPDASRYAWMKQADRHFCACLRARGGRGDSVHSYRSSSTSRGAPERVTGASAHNWISTYFSNGRCSYPS